MGGDTLTKQLINRRASEQGRQKSQWIHVICKVTEGIWRVEVECSTAMEYKNREPMEMGKLQAGGQILDWKVCIYDNQSVLVFYLLGKSNHFPIHLLHAM